jgi:hypothetical protein
MKPAAGVVTGCLLATIVVAGGIVTAQKRPRVLAATGTFRCEAGLPGEACPGTDRVRDDNAGAYAFLQSNGEGSQLNDVGEYYLWLQTGGANRSLVVDLGGKVAGADCELSGCYYQGAWGNLPIINIFDGWLRTNVLAEDGVTELNGGLVALPCSGVARDSRLLITFTNASQTNSTKTVTMALRYYADAFPPSNMVKITRHTRTAFTIEAPTGAAQAVLMGSAVVKGKLSGTRQEGVFDMPFKLNVTVADAPAKTGCAG